MRTKFYNPQRTRNLYNPATAKPFKLSRSKIELFVSCPRCFYLDRRLGVGQPPGFPFNLNSAVDTLLKKEFDYYREIGSPHPLFKRESIEAIPFKHPSLDTWRDSLHGGIQYIHTSTNLVICGGVDDIWINKAGELIIVDYKATSKSEPVSLNADWQMSYKRQMSLYGWLFKRNNFAVSDTGYFVYCNGLANKPKFDLKLEFDISFLPYKIDDSWVEETIMKAHACLSSEEIPQHSETCQFCLYVNAVSSKFE